MKKHVLLSIAACSIMIPASLESKAQSVVVEEESVTVSEVPCKTHFYNTKSEGWFMQLGAGIQVPYVEGAGSNMFKDRHITADYNLGFGKWFSPYLAWRISGLYGAVHYENGGSMNRFRSLNVNADLMWDMFNSCHGVNPDRVFSIVPFVGIGGTYNWKYRTSDANITREGGKLKDNTWLLPVSAGLQFRFRLCKNVDFFAEARMAVYGDNYNNDAYGCPVDVNISAIGGFNINFGEGRAYKSYSPCDYVGYINTLNNQVNDLRGELAATGAALAAAESQLPCPEVVNTAVVEEVVPAPMLTTVRFSINSAVVTPTEMVNVYNVAEYLKANPEVNVVISGYADEKTGTAEYNQVLSERRAKAVYELLTKTYGVSAERLQTVGNGSAVQPYDTNNWNRIVIFTQQ